MNAKKLRNLIFSLHRYLGLFVGLILIVVGLTGSLLVFQHEIDQWAIEQQFGRVIPQQERVSLNVGINNVKKAYADRPELKITGVNTVPKNKSYIVQLAASPEKRMQVKVAGIVTAVFLGLIAFTGFCWNFHDFAQPAIYAVTLSPKWLI